MSGAPTWNAACDSFLEAPGDGRTPAQLRHSLQDTRFNFAAVLDKGRIRRNKGTRRKPTRYTRIHEEWTEREDSGPELLVLGYRASTSGERHEQR